MDLDIKIESARNEDTNPNESNAIASNAFINKDEMEEQAKDPEQKETLNKNINKSCFQCMICPYNTFRRPFLDKHLQQKHGFSKVKVGKMDIKEIKYVKSQAESDDDTEYGCELCHFKSKYLNLLNIHQESHKNANEEVYQCTQCAFHTEDVTTLRDHENTHKNLVLLNCPHCDYATRQKCNLNSHMIVHEDPVKLQKYNCATCKKFVSCHYSALLRHIKLKHGTDVVVFKCDICSFTTKVQRHLWNHQKVHGGQSDVPMFKCEKCDFATYNQQTIQKHVQRHEEREKEGDEVRIKEQGEDKETVWFCCNKCDFRAKDQRYVILHKKVHTRIDEINKLGENILQCAEKKIDSQINCQGTS